MRKLFVIALCALFCTACNWINPSEETPSFIRIESISFSTQGTQGSNNQYFADAWVYIDGEQIGTFELPCTFPVLTSGTHTIQILPGIKLNGISNTRALYPFVKPWEGTITLTEDSVTLVQPASTYYSNLDFANIEEFESGGLSLGETSLSDTTIMRDSDPAHVLEGSYGLVVVDTQHDTADIKSNYAYILPNTGAYNFLELNFKTNAPVAVGVIANTGSQSVYHPVVVLNETSVWKKIYINLTPVVTREYLADSFYYFFRLELPDGMSEARFYIDNIKLIHAE